MYFSIITIISLIPFPSIAEQLNTRTDLLTGVFNQGMFYQFKNKKIMIADASVNFAPADEKIQLDLIIISKNPKIRIAQLLNSFNCKVFVFDASNPAWKIEKWKQECKSLNLSWHSIPETGAFIYNVGI